jgi:hypothetical protein
MDKVGSMSNEAIFKKLITMDIQTDQDQFLRDVHNFYSDSSLANHWLRPIGLDIAEADFVHYAAVTLWERLASDLINDEMIDHMMQEGYVELERRRPKIACHFWLTIWEYLKPRFTSDMRSILDAEIVFAGNQNLYNWTQDMEMELGDLYVFSCNHDFVSDYEKADKIYRMALDRNLDEEGDVTDRIRDMKKKQKK